MEGWEVRASCCVSQTYISNIEKTKNLCTETVKTFLVLKCTQHLAYIVCRHIIILILLRSIRRSSNRNDNTTYFFRLNKCSLVSCKYVMYVCTNDEEDDDHRHVATTTSARPYYIVLIVFKK